MSLLFHNIILKGFFLWDKNLKCKKKKETVLESLQESANVAFLDYN